jgi:type I restriction enzyme R subunit
VSTLAARLAALDRKIDDKARAVIAKAAGGLEPKALVHKLLDAIDPDMIEREAAARRVTPEAAAEALKEEACRPFDDPALRRLLKDIKRQTEIRIDTISTDAVVSSGWDEKKATDTVECFKRFLEERRDELAALQILYRLPYAQRRLTYEAVDDLKEALKRPPWLLEPIDIWRAYKRLASDKVRGNPAGTLADIVMLVRYALGQSEALEPMSSLVAGRFNLWLGREEKVGRIYSAEQRAWLMAIRDHLSVNIEIRPEDMMDAPEFSGRGGIVRAQALFGARLPGLLDDLTDTLVAWYLSMVSINGIYQWYLSKSKEADHECNRQIVHAWPQPGRAPAQGIPLRRQRGAGQQDRRQGDSGARREEAVRCRGVAREA